MDSAFRSLPSVDQLATAVALQTPGTPHPLVADAARQALARARLGIAGGGSSPDFASLVTDATDALDRQAATSLRPVVNATGVILHTNLGRAPVSVAAAAAMAATALAYSNLEFDLSSGGRGSRANHLQQLLRDVTGAEDGFAVNNNASALLLTLSALAAGREAIVSRGQAVEIGGGFRIPDVMKQSGARLIEVGTTNRTYASDYSDAIGPETALVLRVHPSNFRVEGFVHSVGISDLVDLSRRAEVPVLDDVGSGALLDTRAFGLREEPVVQDSIRAGADVVCFSGDKLLGGPQAGIIVGRQRALEAIRRHPLARAVRIDKVSLAGLEATLRHYLRGEALSEVPVWRMIATPIESLHRRAQALATALGSPRAQVVETRATVGGGSLPRETLPSFALEIGPDDSGDRWSVSSVARRLRQLDRPIIARIEQNALILDFRTVFPEDDEAILLAVRSVV